MENFKVPKIDTYGANKATDHEPYNKPKTEKILFYVVIRAGVIEFKDQCRAICNSFICKNGMQGVRPTEIYEDAL